MLGHAILDVPCERMSLVKTFFCSDIYIVKFEGAAIHIMYVRQTLSVGTLYFGAEDLYIQRSFRCRARFVKFQKDKDREREICRVEFGTEIQSMDGF